MISGPLPAGTRPRAEFLSLWAGQGLCLSRETTAGQLVSDVMARAAGMVERLGRND